MDFTSIHPASANQAHRVDLHLWRGAPKNHDPDRPIEILVNDGFVVGFCPSRLQPAWSAYRVAGSKDAAAFDRPLKYYDDMRLPGEERIGAGTFGKLGGVQLNVGHMTPNAVINRQFGRLAQLETFLMSNMSPQYGSLNQGVWLKLEDAIRDIEDEDGKDHVWAIVGPVFDDQPALISRGDGKHLPVPESYFCIVVEPHSYPYDTPSRVHINCYRIPQDAPRSALPGDYPATLDEIEDVTGLEFFASWGRETPIGEVLADAEVVEPVGPSRMEQALRTQRDEAHREAAEIPIADEAEFDSIKGMIEALEAEAAGIQTLQRELTDEEIECLHRIQHTISWLIRARDLHEEPEIDPDVEPEVEPPNLVTYKIVEDQNDKLKTAARTACNFWNGFLEPSSPVVIRLGIFTQTGNTIARAFLPWENEGTRYGRVEFNTKYLDDFTDNEIAGTLVHEIAHTLGIGFDAWDELFSRHDGMFTDDAIAALPALGTMEVERDYGPGTRFSHWDEQIFGAELMTGLKDPTGEFVMPVTLDVMTLLGHDVDENSRLTENTDLDSLLRDSASMVFSRQGEVERIDREHFEETEEFETIPHHDLDDAEAAAAE